MHENSLSCKQWLLCTSVALGIGTASVTWAGGSYDGSMGTTGSFSGAFTIPDTAGMTVDSTLFHSFSDFSINAGESATFTGPAAIDNVISRVTGSNPSTFNGPLTSSIPSANFYFMNPNGMIFKEGASISVDGSFYATTSDSISLGANGVFFANLGAASVLTSSPPSAFGFLDSNPGHIALEGTQLVTGLSLNLPPGATLSLIGGDVTLQQAAPGAITQLSGFLPDSTGSLIQPTGNRFEVVSVASAGSVVPGSGDYDLSSFDTLGNVTITGGTILDTTDVYIRGGNVVISDAMIAPGYLFLAGLTGPPGGGNIDIGATELVSITGTAPIQTFAAPFIPLPDNSGMPFVSGITTFGGSPVPVPPPIASNISISGGDVSVTGVAAVISERLGPSPAGDIAISGNSVEVRNGAFVANINTYDGAGGNITVDAEQVILDGEGDSTGLTGLNASSNFNPAFGDDSLTVPFPTFNPFLPELTYADAGTITVTATGPGGLTIRGGASISSESLAFGRAGDINISASNINLSRDGMPFGAIASQSIFAGDSGNIDVHATGDINIQDGFEITGSTAGTGTGGSVTVSAGNAINISGDNSGIASAAPEPSSEVEDALAQRFGTANFDELIEAINLFAGGPLLQPDADLYDALGALQLLGLINLNDPNPSAGSAGPVSVTASTLNMDGPSRITSSTSSDGNGGSVDVQVGTLVMSNNAEIRSRSGLVNDGTGELEVGSGNGGDITITASNSISMQSGSSISASSLGDGLAGNVSIDAGQRLEMSGSSISTQATVSDGGNIGIMAVERILLDQSEITTSVESGVGGGGNIDIDPDFVILKQSSILANAFGGPGGNINIVAGNFIATPDSVVDASSALGIDGRVNISSPDEEISKDLAVLPDNFLDVTSLISERCGTTAGASSLVDAGPGGMIVDPDGYLPSYATAADMDNEEEDSNSVSSNRWWAPYSHQSSLQIAQLTCSQ